MQVGHEAGRVGVRRRVPDRAPAERAPVLPVLHDRVERQPARAEAARRREHLVLCRVVLLALKVGGEGGDGPVFVLVTGGLV